MSEPRVSIVVPFHSSYARYLRACLDSVRQQSLADWELILVDDASPDHGWQAILDDLADPRIRVLQHATNRGQAAGRNTGMRMARGDCLMPLDCDDALAPTHLEKLVAALDANPACNAAYADYRLFDAAEGVIRFPLRDTAALLREQWIPHPGTVFRAWLFRASGGYSEEPVFRAGNEDWDFFLSLAECGLRATRVAEPSYLYRQHGGSITTTRFATADAAMRERMVQRHAALFDRFGARRAFLAGGYRGTGKAHWQAGARLRGLRLLARGLVLDPGGFAAALGRRLRPAPAMPGVAPGAPAAGH